jgi:(p)ppGpp synthase/HD superfamily hydrolase
MREPEGKITLKATSPEAYSEVFDRALVFAHSLHRNQKRKVSGTAYICHLLGVAALVIEDGGSEEEAIAALLHDSLEDQGASYPGGHEGLRADIEKEFGTKVLRIVSACTEDYLLPERPPGDRNAQWRALKQAYLDHMRAADASVRRVSCADSIHNVRALTRDYRRMGEEVWKRFRTKSRNDQIWFYGMLARVFFEGGVGLAEELDRAVAELCRETGAARPR